MKKLLSLTMIVMIFILGISIERDTEVVIDRNPYDKYINYNMSVNPDNLKMTKTVEVREKDLLNNLFEGLVKEDENGEIIGALAKEFHIEDDGLTYKFEIREDAYYSSGQKIMAKDFVVFFQQFLDDKENIYRNDLDFIYGVKDYREEKVEFSQVAIFADDEEDLLTIRLNSPCPYFLKLLAHPVYTLRDYHKSDGYKEKYKNIRYTGPFEIKNAFQDEIILGKNERYYESKVITEDEIRISFIDVKEDSLTIFEDVENKSNNRIDLIMDIPINEVNRLKKEKQVEEFRGNEILTLSFNSGKNQVGSDMEFRSGVRDILNKELYAQDISNELLTPVYSVVTMGEEAIEVFKPNRDSGVSEVFNSLKQESVKIKVVYEEEDIQRMVVKELCENLTKETGVEFIPLKSTKEEIKEVLDSGEYHMYINKFSFKYDSNFEYFSAQIGVGGDAYKDILRECYYRTEEEAINGFIKCEKMLGETLSTIPLYKVNRMVGFKKDLEGFYVNSAGNIDLKKIRRVG